MHAMETMAKNGSQNPDLTKTHTLTTIQYRYRTAVACIATESMTTVRTKCMLHVETQNKQI